MSSAEQEVSDMRAVSARAAATAMRTSWGAMAHEVSLSRNAFWWYAPKLNPSILRMLVALSMHVRCLERYFSLVVIISVSASFLRRVLWVRSFYVLVSRQGLFWVVIYSQCGNVSVPVWECLVPSVGTIPELLPPSLSHPRGAVKRVCYWRTAFASRLVLDQFCIVACVTFNAEAEIVIEYVYSFPDSIVSVLFPI